MKLKKRELEITYLVFGNVEADLAGCRVRDAILKPLKEEVDNFYKERKDIGEKYADKNEDGTSKIENDMYVFPKKDEEKVNKEFNTLLDEEVEIPEKPGTTGQKLKELMEATQYKPKLGETAIIDSIIARIS